MRPLEAALVLLLAAAALAACAAQDSDRAVPLRQTPWPRLDAPAPHPGPIAPQVFPPVLRLIEV